MSEYTVPPSIGRGRSHRPQLPEEVSAYVRELIISGAVRPGEFLRMERIAEAVGVSNTPVREGLLSLSSEGFVRLIPRRGFVVEPFTRQDIHDLFWAQATLAGELAARAAGLITAKQLARLADLVQQYEDAIEKGETSDLPDLGHLFHREVNVAADSLRLALLLSSVVKHLPNRFYATIEGYVEGTRRDHPRLLKALQKGDAKRARDIMESHILGGADRLVQTLESRGLWDEIASEA